MTFIYDFIVIFGILTSQMDRNGSIYNKTIKTKFRYNLAHSWCKLAHPTSTLRFDSITQWPLGAPQDRLFALQAVGSVEKPNFYLSDSGGGEDWNGGHLWLGYCPLQLVRGGPGQHTLIIEIDQQSILFFLLSWPIFPLRVNFLNHLILVCLGSLIYKVL